MKSKIIVSILLVTSAISAQENQKELPVQPTMHTLFQNMQALFPYMNDEEKFKDPKNEKFISDKLKESAASIKKIKHNQELNSPTLKISRDVLENHFEEIDRIFRIGNKSFARWQLNSTVPICMSCHTQSPSSSRHWDIAELTRGNLNSYEKAELLFMGRDFDDALKLYDEVIRNFPKNKLPITNIEKAYERKIVIFSRAKRDFSGGIKNLQEDLKKNKELPEFIVKNIKAWIALFKTQNREGYPDPKTSNDEKIKKYVEDQIKNNLWDDMIDAENPRLVKNLTVSGIIYEYLNLHPDTKLKPNILYWLALIDKQLQDTLFYSLSDLYLKQCMSDFTSHPMAKKCFEQYKLNTILSYSGSGGTNLPNEVKKELNAWSVKIFGQDKSKKD